MAPGVGVGHHQGRAGITRGADRTEQRGTVRAKVGGRSRTAAGFGPYPCPPGLLTTAHPSWNRIFLAVSLAVSGAMSGAVSGASVARISATLPAKFFQRQPSPLRSDPRHFMVPGTCRDMRKARTVQQFANRARVTGDG